MDCKYMYFRFHNVSNVSIVADPQGNLNLVALCAPDMQLGGGPSLDAAGDDDGAGGEDPDPVNQTTIAP